MSLYKTLPFLGRLFTAQPPIILSLPKNQFELNQAIPQVYNNLYQCSLSFIQALKETNLQYLQAITKPALFETIEKQLTKIQQEKITINQTNVLDQKITQNKKPMIIVRPYVIFGDEVSNRKKHHFDYPLSIARNKFFNYQKSLSLTANFQNIYNKQIYGFHCHLICFQNYSFGDQNGNILIGQQQSNQDDFRVKIVRNQLKKIKPGHQFLITFETDSSQLDFQIVDCNCYLQNLSQK